MNERCQRLRSAMVALLSWLGVPLCPAAPSAQQLPVPDQQRAPAPEQQPAPAPPSVPAAVDATAIEATLSRLDAAFAARDVDRYLREFAPDHRGLHALLEQRLQQVFAAAPPMQHSSHLVGAPTVRGPRTIARVRQEVLVDDGKGAFALPDLLFAFRVDGGRAQPTFAVEIPQDLVLPERDRFRCPACNYEIGAVPGWLCVPVARDRAQAVEASTFYLVGTDLACDVSVRVGDQPQKPEVLVAELAATMQQWEPGARPGLPTPWLPPAHRDAPGALQGARIEIELPPESGWPAGSIALLSVVQLGALEHYLFVRGSRQAMADRRADVDALFASYHVLEPDADRALAAARSLGHHIGGKLTDGAYANDKHRVALTGPNGWRASMHSGGAAFRVSWENDGQSRLWLTGYTVPVGMERWCRDAADCWVGELARRAGIALPREDPAWREDPSCNQHERTLRCSMADPRAGIGTRILHLRMRDDLLLVVDGVPKTPADEVAIQDAIRSLRL